MCRNHGRTDAEESHRESYPAQAFPLKPAGADRTADTYADPEEYPFR
jgi:hypothetical protein